jgi:hypothetical protein
VIAEYKKHRLLFPLALSILSYALLFYVRTQQAWARFGAEVGTYPISGLLRAVSIPLSSDGLRWLSYGLFALTGIGYLWGIKGVLHYSPDAAASGQYVRWVVIPYLLLGLASLFLYPHLSTPTDTVDYTMHARIQVVQNANPYVVPGASYSSSEPLVAHMEAKQRPSVYGPVWQFLSLFPGVIGAGELLPSIFAFKVLFFIDGLVCLWLIWLFHSQPGIMEYRQLLVSGVIVGWNPILHLISHGEGHNDIAMAVFVAMMTVALTLKRPTFSLISWGASALVKFISAPLVIPLAFTLYRSSPESRTIARIKPILIGLAIVALLSIASTAPFGSVAILSNISSRYSGLVGAAGDSKVSIAAGLVSRMMSLVGGNVTPAESAPLIGFALPLVWLLFTCVRTLSVIDVNTCVRVALESFLFYVTFVSIPTYAQYAVTPVILAGFLFAGRWHRLTAVAVSLALAWDSLFIVYLPPTYPAWEAILHQLSHVVVVAVFMAYLFVRMIRFVRQTIVPGKVRTLAGLN